MIGFRAEGTEFWRTKNLFPGGWIRGGDKGWGHHFPGPVLGSDNSEKPASFDFFALVMADEDAAAHHARKWKEKGRQEKGSEDGSGEAWEKPRREASRAWSTVIPHT